MAIAFLAGCASPSQSSQAGEGKACFDLAELELTPATALTESEDAMLDPTAGSPDPSGAIQRYLDEATGTVADDLAATWRYQGDAPSSPGDAVIVGDGGQMTVALLVIDGDWFVEGSSVCVY